ncbi:L,D-transpeptidase, partial [Planctomycetota bacterium]
MAIILSLSASTGWSQTSKPQRQALSSATWKILRAHHWDQHVGDQPGIWIDAASQQVFLIQGERILQRYRCSTGLAGMGNQRNSGKTPLGWHRIGAKIGDKLPVGAVLKARKWTQK